jgi:hypothetical protein
MSTTLKIAARFQSAIEELHTRKLIASVHNFRKVSNLVDWSKRELEMAGLFDKDSDYDGALGPAIMGMIKTFSEQGHSGGSAGIVRSILDKLLNWEPLTPVTDPLKDGYNDISTMWDDGGVHFQCVRDSTIFSDNGGKSWYKLVDDIYADEDGISYTKSRRVPLDVYNRGEGHSVDYRSRTARVLSRFGKREGRELPLELLSELADSISSVKGQLQGFDVMEHWLDSTRDQCIPPEDVQKWLNSYRSKVLEMKKTLIDSARVVKQRTASERKRLMEITERVVTRFKTASAGPYTLITELAKDVRSGNIKDSNKLRQWGHGMGHTPGADYIIGAGSEIVYALIDFEADRLPLEKTLEVINKNIEKAVEGNRVFEGMTAQDARGIWMELSSLERRRGRNAPLPIYQES